MGLKARTPLRSVFTFYSIVHSTRNDEKISPHNIQNIMTLSDFQTELCKDTFSALETEDGEFKSIHDRNKSCMNLTLVIMSNLTSFSTQGTYRLETLIF